jgi:hypothetical protein
MRKESIDTTNLKNYVEVVDDNGVVVAVYDYDSGAYDNGLPGAAYLMHLRFYKDGQLASKSNV